MANEPFTIAEAELYIPELWSPTLLDAVKCKLVMADLTVDRSAQLQGGDRLKIPRLGAMAANPKQPKQNVTLQQPAGDAVSLEIDQHVEASILVEDAAAAVTKYNLIDEFIRVEGAAAIAKKFDADLLTLYSEAQGAVQAGGHTGDDLKADLLRMLRQLNEADAPEEERFFVIHPATLERLLALDPVISRDYNPMADGIVSGQLNMLLGAKIFVTTNVPATVDSGVTTYHNLYFQKNAFTYAVALGPRVQFAYLQDKLGTLATADMAYGVAAQRPSFAVEFSISE
ncbi:MAG: hypothetical protein GX444_08265 [Myxococcales bacterium]|nr:hypothetical protein [Myxococcales bacterium]